MSFVHYFLIGHFDPCAISFERPAALRPLDVERAQHLLKTMCPQIPEQRLAENTTFSENGITLVWSGLMAYFDEIFQYACRVADAEDCIVIDATTPPRIVYPMDQDLPWGPEHLTETAEEAERVVESNDFAELRVLLRKFARAYEKPAGVPELCLRLARHDHFQIRGNAMFALGGVAARYQVDRDVIQPVIERGMDDDHAYVRQQAEAAARRAELHLRWVFPHFDNGKPEIEAVTYSNAWILCANCGWRFSTNDPGAFREGRCIGCRQRIRLVKGPHDTT